MSLQAFERRVGFWLKAIPDCWSYHPVDGPYGKPFLPADFLVCMSGRLSAIECKNLESGFAFPLSRWTPSQRQSCATLRAAGARYLLLVNYSEWGAVGWFEPDPSVARGSLAVGSAKLVTKGNLAAILMDDN